MPATYTLIANNTLSSSAASVTFSAIPGTYTDLVLRLSLRTDQSNFRAGFYIHPNNETTSSTNGSATNLFNNGTSIISSRNVNAPPYRGNDATGTFATANSFSSVEFYIPNYAGATNKPASNFGVQETNSATDARIFINGGLYSNTSAITKLVIAADAGNFVSGSLFFLYGIKNS